MSKPTFSNSQLLRRLIGLALRYRLDSAKVIGLQSLLLALGLSGLSLTGFGIDYIRFALSDSSADGTDSQLAHPTGNFGFTIPESWSPMTGIACIAGAILVLALFRAVLNFNYTVAVNRLVQERLVVDLRGEVYDRLQRMSFRFFDAHTTGSIITRVTSDVQSVRMFMDQVLIQAFIMVVSLAIYIAYMVSLSPSLTVACLATTPVLVILSTVFSKRIQPLYATNQSLVDRLVQRFAETVIGMQVIKAFGLEAQQEAAFNADNANINRHQRTIFWRVSLFSPSVGFLTRINIAILLGYGGWLVIHGELPLGSGLVVFAGLLEQFSGQVNQVATIANSVQQSLIGAGRVFEILDAPVETQSPEKPVEISSIHGDIAFENVSFAYDGIESVLRDIDLVIDAGKCIAILGATGAGKSAIMSLIPRFFDPTSGRVLIDGIDARSYRLQDLRRNVGIVFQESFLFSNTVAANIAFGHPDATQEQIERAAHIAAAHDFIMSLPHGYDTVLGESGNSLSGGQRQRLAIARAILLNPPILLLDDPTAAIDSETENEIFTALDQATKGRTTFLVAHRLSTLRRADEIIVMEQGRIVQRGTHEQLIAQSGPYLRVAELQLLEGLASQPGGSGA